MVDDLVWQCCGIIGLEPWRFRLRELYAMAEARRSADWDAPAALWALWAELNRDNKKRSKPFTSSDIHPFHRQELEKPRPISELRSSFKHG